jgi:hypothetical protein
MAEKTRDQTDHLLESMFRSEPIADDGFSNKVVSRVRRAIWVRRLALPIAMLIGAAIAAKPASELVQIIPKLLSLVPPEVTSVPLSMLPQIPTVVMGGMVLAVGLAFLQSLTDQ